MNEFENILGYQKIDPELVLPTMRSDVEKALNLIAAGSADFNSVLKHAIEIFRMKFLFFVQNICVMDSLFEASFASIADSGKAFSRCGKCRRYMKYIQTKPARLHCTQCDDTYTLPKDGTVRLVLNYSSVYYIDFQNVPFITEPTRNFVVRWMILNYLHFQVAQKGVVFHCVHIVMPIHLSKGCQTMVAVIHACIRHVHIQ